MAIRAQSRNRPANRAADHINIKGEITCHGNYFIRQSE